MAHGERQFAADLADFIRRQLRSPLTRHSLGVETNVRILSDVTCSGTASRPPQPQVHLKLSCLEQDIAIGRWVETPEELRPFLTNVKPKTHLFIPRVVIEVKYAGVNSHTIMTYSEIAGRLKGVYEGLRYYFLLRAGSKDPATLERHGRMFDRIYQLERIRQTGGASTLPPYTEGDWSRFARRAPVQRGLRRLLSDIRGDLTTPRVWSEDRRG